MTPIKAANSARQPIHGIGAIHIQHKEFSFLNAGKSMKQYKVI
jgi:hypothetical protein